MFKNLFKKEKKEEKVTTELTIPTIEPMIGVVNNVKALDNIIIDAAFIGRDISSKLDILLDEIGVNTSLELRTEALKEDLKSFKAKNESIYTKIENLKTLGLINTPTIKKSLQGLEKEELKIKSKVNDLQSQIKENNRISDLINQYSITFPGYKFVPSHIMTTIMKKYDLFLGDSSLYAKEIPNSNLETILNFKDKITVEELEVFSFYSDNIYSGRWVIKSGQNKKIATAGYNGVNSYTSDVKSIFKYARSNFKMIAPLSHFNECIVNVPELGNVSLLQIHTISRNISINTDIINKELKKLEVKKEVLDPIAALEVEGGYIIMSAWDKEAEIEEIQMPINN